jgi:hypothetical protein
MDQDDADTRFAEWQRQVAEQNASPGGAERLKTWLFRVASVGLLLYAVVGGIGYLAYQNVGYYAGTPTTATIHECSPARGWRADCTASWSIRGESHTGTINLDRDYPAESSIAVRAYGGRAYAAPPCIVLSRICFPSSYLLIVSGVALCAVGFFVGRRWWRTRTGRSRTDEPQPT